MYECVFMNENINSIGTVGMKRKCKKITSLITLIITITIKKTCLEDATVIPP